MSPIISPDELLQLSQKENFVLVDARNSQNPKEVFEQGHLKGAVFVDPNLELADIKENLANGGRHPLPSVQDFREVLGKLGINRHSHVVAYDDQNGANSAARFWWMLRALGHEKVQILEGGIQGAKKVGYPLEVGKSQPKPKPTYPANGWGLPIASMEEVKGKAGKGEHILIDVRSAERYRGEQEPIDLIAGHIPGAINVPLTQNMDESGNFLKPERLRQMYQEVLGTTPPENIIVHCGSGVSACHTLLAMDLAGLGIPKLYVGSWSEWSRNNMPTGKSSL